MLPPIHDPKQHTKNQDPPKNKHTIIHALNRRILLRRPHREKRTEYRIRNRSHRDRNAEAAKTKRAPWDIRVGSAEAFVQHDGGGEDEGGVVGGYDEGDEGAETDGGADVDEGEEEIDDCCGGDGVEGEVGALVDLLFLLILISFLFFLRGRTEECSLV